MHKALWLSCVVAFLFANAARGSGPIDITTLAEFGTVETIDGDVYLYNGSGGDHADNIYLFAYDTGSLTIGSSGGSPELGVGATFRSPLFYLDDNSVAEIVSAAGAARGTVLHLDQLETRKSTALAIRSGIDSTAGGKNRLIVDSFPNTDNDTPDNYGVLTVHENAVLEIRHSALVNSQYSYCLAGGEMSFADSIRMNSGIIEAVSGNSFVAAANGITLHHTQGSFPIAPTLRVHDGATLTLLKTLGGAERGDLAVGADGVLDIRGGVLNAGVVRFDQAYVLDQAQSGTVNADKLEFTSLEDAAALDWRVRDAVSFAGTYRTKGTGNLYAGGMAVASGGVLTADIDADTAVALGSSGARGELLVDGGVIRAAGGRDFAVRNADIVLAAAPAGAVLDAGAGSLDLSESAVIVDAADPSAVMIFDAAGGIVAGTYAQRSGIVEADGAPSGFAVAGRAVIGGGTAETTYRAVSDAGSFRSGLEVRENGVLAGTAGGNGVIGLGGDLILAGGGVLDGTAGVLSLADPSGQAAVRVNGEDNLVQGTVSTALGVIVDSDGMALGLTGGTLEAGSFVVERGGVYASQTPATIRNVGPAGNVFRVAQDGALETRSATLDILGYDGVAIDGMYTVGWDGAGIATLRADSDIVLGATAGIGFTDELLANIRPGSGAVIIETSGVGNAVRVSGNLGSDSLFGTIGMELVDGKLAVTSVSNGIARDYSAGDIALATANMRRMWGDGQISSALGALAYGAAVPPYQVAAVPGNEAGGKNVALLQALANPAGRSASTNTVEYMNGAHAAGVNEAALRTAAAVNEHIGRRVRAVHDELGAARESAAADEALPALAMNDAPENRFWLAGTRVWEDVDGRDGFSGYEYDAHGFIMGYDRVLSGNIALGVSFAYTRGDYGDGGALAHASTIDSHSVSVYGAYSHESGWYAGATAGYTYSDNDIRELRNDPSAASGHSWAEAEYHTGTWTLGIDAGFDYSPVDYLTLTPSFGLLYLHSSGSDHDALLGGAATQRERGIGRDALLLPAKLSARYVLPLADGGRLVLEGSVGYRFNFLRGGIDGTVDYYGLSQPASAAVRGRRMSRHGLYAGLGARLVYKQFDFGVEYGYAGGSGYSAHRVTGNVGAWF